MRHDTAVIDNVRQHMKNDLTNWQNRQLSAPLMAQLYGVSLATIWRWAKEGTIPAPRKIGKNTTRWDGQEVAKNMESPTT